MIASSFDTNPQLKLASDFVQFTNKNIFLTGKAGTGKTTFLHYLKKTSPKRMAIVAPTGVAAINAGGVTIHSFFQLSFGPQVPEYLLRQSGNYTPSEKGLVKKFNREKINLIQSLDLLVIDEISMVRADMLDGIDEVLRKFKNHHLPFGGVQLLMIGDLHQLSPVIKDDEWQILKQYYDTGYFFSSRALQDTFPVCIELKHIYRQSDAYFIQMLNSVRDNNMDYNTLKELNERYIPNFKPSDDEGYITLTSHNATSQQINQKKLTELAGNSYFYKADIAKDFPSYAYPTDENLELKVNAQVMFVKNDSSKDKNYFNGKIGKITKIEDGVIYVKCENDSNTIAVGREEWQNIKYALNTDTKEINEEIIGSFKQYPLKLAWAITIHKSQGLTFEKVIIDAGSAFAHGQVYVALSRCKTFEGIVLRSPIPQASIKTDVVVAKYTQEIERNLPDETFLNESKSAFQQILVKELFNFIDINKEAKHCTKMVEQNAFLLVPNNAEDLIKILEILELEILTVAQKFNSQINELLTQNAIVENNEPLKERIIKASTYFKEKFDILLLKIKALQYESDNKGVRITIKDAILELEKAAFVKHKCLVLAMNGFNVNKYIQIKANADIDFTALLQTKRANIFVPKGTPNTDLYIAIKHWRTKLADEQGQAEYLVMPQNTLLEIVSKLPINTAELAKIKGLGKKKITQFGKDILEMVKTFCIDNKIDKIKYVNTQEEMPMMAKPAKADTKSVSFDLFKQGKSIEEIAKERGFSPFTIEGHLVHYIGTGEIEINKLVAQEKIDKVQAFTTNKPVASLTAIKAEMPEDISYSDIKCVLEYVKYLKTIEL